MKKQAPRWYYHFVSINYMLLEIYKGLIKKNVPFWFDQFFFFAKDILPSGYVKIAIENDHRNSG
jgi:hypothetical protein